MYTKLSYVFVLLILYSCAFAQIGDRCVLKSTGEEGRCKLSQNCPSVEEQANRGIQPTICGQYQLIIPIVCCENSPINRPQANDNTFLNGGESPDSISFPDDNPSYSGFISNSMSKSEIKCLEYSKNVTGLVQAISLVPDSEPINISIEKCDYNSVALIVGGKPASAGEFPFMAALGFSVDNTIEWRCGATLVSEYFVLTAAHCTFSRDADAPRVIRVGDLDLTKTNDGSEEADYDVAQIIVHPQYRFPQKYNDIALIRAAQKIQFSKFVRPACLYTKHHIQQKNGIATGWGKTDYAAENSDILLKVSLNIYNNSQCAQVYGTNKQLPEGIKSNMICAGELKGGHDTCQGDSGGPLIITKKGNQCKFFVIGVTSFGKSCGVINTPAIYTRVSDFVSWIEQTIW